MITTKELQYVDSWASKIPMPGIEYSKKVIEEMKKCLEVYNKKYKDKEYIIIFSNSEEIKFGIQPINLCHMLGIDYSNIKGEYFSNYRHEVLKTLTENFSSYELLEAILEHSDKVIELDNDKNNRIKVINYFKSAIKCEIFNKLSNFDKFNFGAINYFEDNTKQDYSKQKILFMPSNEAVCPYFLVIIQTTDDEYFVKSLLAPDDIKKYFDNQEVIIPTQMLINDNEVFTKNIATAEDKMRLLTIYKSIIFKYGLKNCLSIFGDYEATLNDVINENENKPKVFIKQ